MSIVYAILVFGLLIFVHELGHFIAAKLAGVNVLQFTIGFGPAIFKKEYKGTIYALRLLPFGGAVMMEGESEEEEILAGKPVIKGEKKGISYLETSKPKKLAISVAGSAMNLIAGILIVFILMVPANAIITPKIQGFMDGFANERPARFMAGDEIVKANGFTVYIYNDLLTALSLREGKPMDFVVERDGKKIELTNVILEKKSFSPSNPDVPLYGFEFKTEEIGLFGKVKYAFDNCASFLQSAFKSIGMLIKGEAKTSDMIGAVGIAGELNQRAKTSMSNMWYFVAFISVNLAFVNMLPIPGLDGGKVLFMLAEAITRKKINPKYEAYISLVGLVLLLGLMVVVTYNDIVKLISR